MIEVRFHGRGGQGAVIAGKILACALFKEGMWVQSFPAFGVERRGAPVAAFTRFDRDKILIRNNIYEPNHIVVLDPTLLQVANVTAGLHKGGWILINSPEPPESFSGLDDFKLATVDAQSIALRFHLGSRSSPIVNTSILGGFAKATGLVGIDSVVEAIVEEVPIKPDNNAEAARVAYEATVLPA
ncbi:MAG: 2-oxoacid:acceptor oxidoreductase family protein [Candidatus Alcyoniella australis]|nr:2-oxoacid:acceptor oxidoreductase family protein [Candidatus Alcyoniella australis]